MIENDPRMNILDDGTLMIANTQGKDMGYYECKASNKMGEIVSRKAKIIMADAPATTTTTVSPGM